jgi:hypothetical protein
MSMSNPSAARLATAARSWTRTSVQSRAAVVVLAATVMVVAAGFGTSNAATNYLRQHPAFAAQARSAGLSLGQALALQSRVDGYLRTIGGVQMAANQIDINGNRLTVAVPGESRARSLTASSSTANVVICFVGDICMWSSPNHVGDQISTSSNRALAVCQGRWTLLGRRGIPSGSNPTPSAQSVVCQRKRLPTMPSGCLTVTQRIPP